MPDCQATIEHLVVEGDKVAIWANISATHHGELAGIPASGKRVSFALASIMRFANGKFAEEWELGDTYTMLQQIGAIQPPS
jgi:predicted ester cyclase